MDDAASRWRLVLERPETKALVAAAGERPCHLVGGALRDHLLRRPPADLDAVVAGDGEGVAARLARRLGGRMVRLGGDRFAAFRVAAAVGIVDLWDRGRASLRADLERRDLRINAIALDPRTGRVEDPFDGIGDVERRVLRAVHDGSFVDDPLRTLRLARFVAVLPGFRADPATTALAAAAAPGLDAVARERIREELAKLMAGEDAAAGVEQLARIGLYPALFVDPAESSAARSASDAGARAAAALARLDRAAAEIHAAAGLPTTPADGRAASPAARWALLAALVAEVAGAGAGVSAPELPSLWRRRGRITSETERAAARLLAAEELPHGPAAGRRFLHATGAAWPDALAVLVARGESEPPAWRRTAAELAETARRDGETVFDPPTLVDGREAQRLLGLEPGPELGARLAGLRWAQVEGRVRSRAEAIDFLRGEDRR